MVRPTLRRLGIVLVAAVGVLPLAPPAHVHDTVDEAGHHGVVAHRHAEAHAPHAAAPVHEPTHLEDSESVVATLAPVFLGAPSFDLPAPALPEQAVALGPDPFRAEPLDPFVERQLHGPPRSPILLRGPPVLS